MDSSLKAPRKRAISFRIAFLVSSLEPNLSVETKFQILTPDSLLALTDNRLTSCNFMNGKPVKLNPGNHFLFWGKTEGV
jgi:hypothetical protein